MRLNFDTASSAEATSGSDGDSERIVNTGSDLPLNARARYGGRIGPDFDSKKKSESRPKAALMTFN